MRRSLSGGRGLLLAVRQGSAATASRRGRAAACPGGAGIAHPAAADPAAPTETMRALRSLIPRRGALAELASLRWAALPVTNRRWTLPMSAVALGLGLFIGVAIGPGISTTLGTSPLLVVTGPPASAPAHASSAAGETGGGAGAPAPNGQVDPSQPAHPGAGIGVAAPGPGPSAGFPVPSVTPVAPTSTSPT